MATYAIGDIQGCHDVLLRLLRRIAFDAGRDRLWLVGDLVNRGPRSLDVLRWARGLGDRATTVLGNHDLHLLAVASGQASQGRGDTLDAVLAAPDRDDLVEWLRTRPLLHAEGGVVMVHAGLFPQWSVERAAELAREAEAQLRSGDWSEAVAVLRGRRGRTWSDSLRGDRRLATIGSAFTRLRTCTAEGRPCHDFKGPPELAPDGCMPWFDVPGRRSAGATVVFGHWAALGLVLKPGVVALDTGCAWGRHLTAVRLEDRAVFQEPAGGRREG